MASTPAMEKTKTPGIFKRGGSYVVVYRDPQGRQRKRFARTMGEARDLKATLRADVTRGEYRSQSKVTFVDYAAEWIDSYTGRTRRGISEETRASYGRSLGLDENGRPLEGAVGAVGFSARCGWPDRAP